MTTDMDYAPMDIPSLLDSEEAIAEYLTAAVEDANPDVLLMALGDVAKARGMAQVAKAAGLGRESLYKALAPGAHPRFETIIAVFRALNVRVNLKAVDMSWPIAPPGTNDDVTPVKRGASAKAKTIAETPRRRAVEAAVKQRG